MSIDFSNMAVGDKHALPDGEWHRNPEAKEIYAAANTHSANSTAEPKSQFQINTIDKFRSEIERIR